jgi:EmrB/QacA subfamily drug resistance transporter
MTVTTKTTRAPAPAKKDAKAGEPKAAAKTGAPRAETKALTHREVRAIVIGIMLAMFLGALDQTIVATALPTIGRAFDNVESLSWIVTAYLVTATAVTPLYGKLSDIHGRRVVMLTGIVLFVAGSLICAMAPGMGWLIAGRVVQGLGGGGLMSLAQTILADIVTPRERGRYQGYIGAVFAASSIGGPVLGGVLSEHLHWSFIFWINLPLGLLALGMTSSVLRRVPFRPRKHKLDILGAVLMASAAVALLLALNWGGTRFLWLSWPIGALIGGSAMLWALFAWRLVSVNEPFPPLAVLGNPVVRCASLSGACSMGVLVGMTIFTPLYFEVVRHLTASESGLALIPMVSATVVASTFTGRAMVHVERYKRMPLAGLVLGILALGALAIWPARLPVYGVIALMMVAGGALGTVFPVSTVGMQNAVAPAQVGIATGAANFFRSLVSAMVVALLGAILLGGVGGATGVSVETLARTASGTDLATAFRFVFLACALVLGFGLAFMIAMEEKPLRGPAQQKAKESVGSASPIQPIPPEKGR